ncbi:MAG: nitrous oxide-stimulated promoter family protein [bacterium]
MGERKNRILREAMTVEAMIRIYCQDLHGNGGHLCGHCEELLRYARARLEKCPFQEGKTTCALCKVHCYRPDKRDLIKSVMRHSGPHMTYRHPLLALRHFMDGFRKNPKQRRGKPKPHLHS